MPSQKNIQQLKDLKEKAAKAKSLALADYRGLTVAQMTQLRNSIKEAGGELLVAKNTLLKLALDNKELSQENILTGPTLTLFAYEDEITPLKAMVEFEKENELPSIKAGFLGKEFLVKEKVLALAQLPGLNEVKAQLVRQVGAPLSSLVFVLSASIRQLIYALNAIVKKKQSAN